MKKIANISQTYSYNRSVELELFLSLDNIKALRCLDIITFSFHNCSYHFKEYYKSKIKKLIPECIIFEFENISYGESIIKYLHNIKELGATDFILWQDDHIIKSNKDTIAYFNKVLNFYKTSNINYLKIFYDYINPFKNYKLDTISNIDNEIKLYKYNIKDVSCNILIYSDENYLMNLDIAIKNIFTEDIINKNVWEIEFNLYKKVVNIFHYIYITNLNLFNRFDIHGRNNKPYFLIYSYIEKEKLIVHEKNI